MPIFGTLPLREYRPKIMAASAALAPKTPRLYALTQRLRRLLARFLPRAADAFDCAVAMRCGFTRFRAPATYPVRLGVLRCVPRALHQAVVLSRMG